MTLKKVLKDGVQLQGICELFVIRCYILKSGTNGSMYRDYIGVKHLQIVPKFELKHC